MLIFAPKETKTGETRAALVPSCVKLLTSLGAKVGVESGIGENLDVSDTEYLNAGAVVFADQSEAIKDADVIFRVNAPSPQEIALIKSGACHISFLNPFQSDAEIEAFRKAEVNAVSMEMIPRTTIAQKFDALSSQASLAGYVAVILAAEQLNKIFPMMMTPAGTISPARVFVIGAGVAGLQAIATAKRLGARVDAFDTRPDVAEQIQSLGAKFVKVDLGETGQTSDGYAKELTQEQLQRQQEAMANVCAQSDVIITTAQVFGKRAPLIITEDILDRMKPGSVIVDLAIESGGNVAGAKLGEVVNRKGVRIMGYGNLPGRVPFNASEMYANNLTGFIEHFWNKETNSFQIDPNNEIIQKCLLTHQGELVNSMLLGV